MYLGAEIKRERDNSTVTVRRFKDLVNMRTVPDRPN